MHKHTCNGNTRRVEKRAEKKMFKDTMAENFSDLLKNKLHFGEAQKNKGRYIYISSIRE